MRSRTLFFILFFFIVCFSGLYGYTVLWPEQKKQTGDFLFPKFDTTIVSAMTIDIHGETYSLLKDKTEKWSLMEKDGVFWPEDETERLIKTLSLLKKDVEATKDKGFYKEEGVDEMPACSVTLFDAEGSSLGTLLIGNRFEESNKSGYFVRFSNEKQSFKTYTDETLCFLF